jgi:hypothetical protein
VRVRAFYYMSFTSLRSSSEKRVAPNQGAKNKETEEDQVVVNAKDEIGDRISSIREMKLFYGPMIVHICGGPHKFKLSVLLALRYDTELWVESNSARGRHTSFQQIPELSTKDNAIYNNLPDGTCW